MFIIENKIGIKELKKIAENSFGYMTKGVVDVEKEILAIDAEMHADIECLLLENGSIQKNLWGINLYPDDLENFVEFDSMINIRPTDNNRTRGVDDSNIRKKIIEIVNKRIIKG